MSAVNRRQFMQGSASVAGAVAAALYAEKSKAAFFLGGSTPAGGSGFYPSGHWIAAKQAMLQVYPRPDAETSANARHHWAYWDGTNDIAYEITLGVAFGAFPFVFELLSGPPGMYIEATTWNTAWMPGNDAATNGYGKIVWHPQGNISSAYSGTVSVKVTDQERNTLTISWALQTSSSTANFLFINQDTGLDTNSGSISAPLKSLAGAFGSTYTTSPTNFNAGAHVYVYGSATDYPLPNYTDQTTLTSAFVFNTATKPMSLMTVPGDSKTVTLDATGSVSGSGVHMGAIGAANDLFLQGFTANGSSTTLSDFSLIGLVSGSAGQEDRMTFDGLTWTNAGYGSSGLNPASFIDTNDTHSSTASKKYLFVTGLTETGRDNGAGSPTNNIAGCCFYCVDSSRVQYSSATNTSGSINASWFCKSDTSNVSMCQLLTHFSSSGYSGWLQAPNSLTASSEYAYCLFFNLDHFGVPDLGYYNWGTLWLYRCSFPNMNFGLNCNDILGDPPSNMLSAIGTTTGGSLSAGTYDYCVTARSDSPGGESLPSNIQSITISAGQAPVLTWNTSVTGASGFNIYRRVSGSGSFTTCFKVLGAGTSTYTDIGAGNASFTGVTSTTTLNVSALTGTIQLGTELSGTQVATGTFIVSGSGTTYTIYPSQSDSSESMSTAPFTASPPTSKGPYVYDSNAFEVSSISGQPPTYPHCQNDGVNTIPGNQVGTAGTIFNTDGTLKNSSDTGLVGAIIS